jgi:GxxExxY protein
MTDIILKDESYKIIGICMEVHRLLDMGFKEIVYKDALTLEFKSQAIPFTREKKFEISYKGIICFTNIMQISLFMIVLF